MNNTAEGEQTQGQGAEPVGPDGDSEDTRTYTQAMAELEELLDELEGADIDVDRLAERVARGAELIRFCRARLDVVTADVDAVVADLISVDDLTEDPQ